MVVSSDSFDSAAASHRAFSSFSHLFIFPDDSKCDKLLKMSPCSVRRALYAIGDYRYRCGVTESKGNTADSISSMCRFCPHLLLFRDCSIGRRGIEYMSDILIITANIFAIGMLHALYSKLPAVVVMLLGFSPRESIGILIDDRNAERTISSVIESI
jgi:hypothetical protein